MNKKILELKEGFLPHAIFVSLNKLQYYPVLFPTKGQSVTPDAYYIEITSN